ncbi:sugar phosphate isomerase/epimerase [Pseudoalteromonas sp. SG45-5]|uniref:sugar phosphate isomerase/epimerase family protein n=2 Tax=Pseudoalteromonas TaxID=53246 RepID=UPI0015F88D52|nr:MULTISPECIES: sugar phosphate isomerase/epimerase [unclassified Pseudoalteromonas]MBB1386046.1 sugar phosphate isomerase/epimerase [Pseudoalteromonas sp. SG45-5]MBB1393893.1 sugar phosphate isomerase/epimerase [Pseudoalteromonas sp. SG44-4]MBB1446057.1 sugar phosphate isomerase/epimerase [Pseudoalteromonas sp. SG41-6]
MFKNTLLHTTFIVLTTLIFTLHSLSAFAAMPKPMPRVSVQLWSVKEALKNDFDSTLLSLSEMGFDGVEFAGDLGSYKNNPSELKKKLASLNLVASSAHIGFDSLTEKTLTNTLLFYKTLGVKVLFVPWDERAWHPTGVTALTKQLAHVNDIAQRYDMRIGFHNHDKEFNQFNDATYWDYIAKNTPQSLPLQLDIGWVHFAGKEPTHYIKKYSGRTFSTHLKVRTHQGDGLSPIFGENDYLWKVIIDSLIMDGDLQWLVIEQEEYPNNLTPLESVAQSKSNLDKILKEMTE